MINCLILDLDGTITSCDMLDWACDLSGKKEDAKRLMATPSFGINSLVTRINLLSGLSLEKLEKGLEFSNYLRSGAQELVKFAKQSNLIVIICSGNIQPIVEYYKNLLLADYALGSPVDVSTEGVIIGTKQENFLFKENLKVKLVSNLFAIIGLNLANSIVVGDSSVDVNLFKQAQISISVGQNEEAKKASTYQIQEDLLEIIPIIKQNI